MRYIAKKDLLIICYYIGILMIGLGISNLIPIIVSIIYSEGPSASLSYIIPGFLSIVMGIVFRKFGSSHNINLKHAMIVSSSIWLWASFIGSLTMVLLVGIKSIDGFNFISGFNFVDGFLESMSAWTTSGHTIFTNVEILPHSLNFLRCFEQWMGGLGIVTLLMGLMLRSGKSTLELYKSEARNEKISPSMGSTLKKIIEVYVFFTIMGILLFIIAGMPIFDSICQTFTQLSTGGAPITSMSMGHYHNNLFNLISIFIMIIGGTSFLTLYKIVKSKGFSFLSDIQFRGMMFLIIIFSILIYFITNMPNIPNMPIMNIVYDVVSAITSTGTSLESSQDIANFAPFVKISLIVLMIIGPAAGSTGGAVKIIRVIIIIKGLYTQVLEVLSPKDRLIKIKISNQEINDSLINEANSYFSVYMLMLLMGWLVLTLYTTNDPIDSLFEVVSAQGNVGLSTGIVGHNLPLIAKIMLIINMWVGRLEIIPIFVFIRAIFTLFRIKNP